MKRISFILTVLLLATAGVNSSAKVKTVNITDYRPIAAGGQGLPKEATIKKGDIYISRIDFQYSIGNGPFIPYGSMSVGYNENNNPIRTEIQLTNTDDIINLTSPGRYYDLPLNATLYKIRVNDTDEQRYEMYYVNPQTGDRTDLLVCAATLYDGKETYFIEKSLNDAGQMIEYAKTESEFDGQGRPTVTVVYAMGEDSTTLVPDLRYEYDYLADDTVSVTTSKYITDIHGNGYWQYKKRTTEKRDSTGRLLYNERMSFDTTLHAFYLTFKEGYIYNDDASQQTHWYIMYNDPLTREQLSTPDSLIYSGYQGLTTRYTEKELGISLANCPNLELPEKSVISFYLSSIENGVYNWEISNRTDYEYALLPQSYDNPELTFKNTSAKIYDYDPSGKQWTLEWDMKSGYDQYGEQTSQEQYQYGVLKLDIKKQFRYVKRYIDGDSILVQLPLLSTATNGKVCLDSTYYEYNHKNEFMFSYRFRNWNQTDNTWKSITKDTVIHNENGVTAETWSKWDYNTGEWLETDKEETIYNDTTLTRTWIKTKLDTKTGTWTNVSKTFEQRNTYDEVILSETYEWDNTLNCWIGLEKSEVEHDARGNELLKADYEWDSSTLSWKGISRTETQYDSKYNTRIRTIYSWDNESDSWIKDKQINDIGSSSNTGTTITIAYVSTQSLWNSTDSLWHPDMRETKTLTIDQNIEFLLTNEKYNSAQNKWEPCYSAKDIYVYSDDTQVSSIIADAQIYVSDGTIYVDARQDSLITISSVSGGTIASGTGSVSTWVTPGIYLITVNGKTIKTVVR